jgi:hypothetical protein
VEKKEKSSLFWESERKRKRGVIFRLPRLVWKTTTIVILDLETGNKTKQTTLLRSNFLQNAIQESCTKETNFY